VCSHCAVTGALLCSLFQLSPKEVVQLLVTLYSLFDALVSKHGGVKMETVGKTYMAAFGLHVRV
jgi:class 3 adenylate cyclase